MATHDEVRQRLELAVQEDSHPARAVRAYVTHHRKLNHDDAMPIALEALQEFVARMLAKLADYCAQQAKGAEVSAAQRWPKYCRPQEFASILHIDRSIARSTINRLKDQQKKKKPVSIGDRDRADPREDDFNDWTTDCSRAFRQAWATFHPRDRLLMRLRHVENWTYRQMAQMFLPHVRVESTAIGQIRTQLVRLARRARQLIEDDSDGSNCN